MSAVDIRDVVRHFPVGQGLLRGALGGGARAVKAVDGVSFRIRRGETFSLVGESGCGKSTLARLIAGLDAPTAGSIRFADAAQKGHRVQMVFQDPYASLNPRYRVGTAIAQPMRFQKLVPAAQISPRVHELLRQVGLADADAAKFPHEFSGGQRQRVSIARALAGQPSFLVCDEPTSSLDVSVQAQILNLDTRTAARARPHLPFHQPQPRGHQLRFARRGGDVSGPPRRSRAHARVVRGAEASVHAASPRSAAAPRHARARSSSDYRRNSKPARSAVRLRISSAVPACQRALPRGASGIAGGVGRGAGGLPRGRGTTHPGHDPRACKCAKLLVVNPNTTASMTRAIGAGCACCREAGGDRRAQSRRGSAGNRRAGRLRAMPAASARGGDARRARRMSWHRDRVLRRSGCR